MILLIRINSILRFYSRCSNACIMIPPVAQSQKSSGELAWFGKQCLRWIGIYGDTVYRLRPSSAFTIHISLGYISMGGDMVSYCDFIKED